jgi:4-amino-4-deoxychorismate lyase
MSAAPPADAAGAPEVVLVNGSSAASLAPLDRGLHFGDGLFETIACRGRRPRLLDWHLERLALGCARLHLPPFGADELRQEILALARAAENSIIKVIVTRGSATARGYGPSGREKPTRITLRYRWPDENPDWSTHGVRVRTAALRLGENPALAGLKHLNRLEQVLARAENSDPQIAEALLFSSSGLLVSGTMSNVFIVSQSRLRTPRLDRCGVAGVMRRAVLGCARSAGVDVAEAALRAEDLADAQEIFLTNARVGIWPVRQLDARALTPGPVTRALQIRLAPLLEEPPDA